MKFAAVLCAAILTACGIPAATPDPIPTQPQPAIQLLPVETVPMTTIPLATTTTTTTTLVPADTPCAEWADEAVAGGWPADDTFLLTEVLSEAWQESRCLPIGADSPHFNGSDYGQMQINRRTHHDYVVSLYGSWEKIVDPITNFGFAWRLYSETEARGGCGFKAWSRPCR